jgi:hypothetical protein
MLASFRRSVSTVRGRSSLVVPRWIPRWVPNDRHGEKERPTLTNRGWGTQANARDSPRPLQRRNVKNRFLAAQADAFVPQNHPGLIP